MMFYKSRFWILYLTAVLAFILFATGMGGCTQGPSAENDLPDSIDDRQSQSPGLDNEGAGEGTKNPDHDGKLPDDDPSKSEHPAESENPSDLLPETQAITSICQTGKRYIIVDDTGKATPKGAALALAELLLEDMGKDDDLSDRAGKTFVITEYRNLSVDVFSTIWGREANRGYGITDEEFGDDKWIVEFNAEFRFKGTINPIGESDGSEWFEALYHGGPAGFLMTKDGDIYTLTSRFIDHNQISGEPEEVTAVRYNLDQGVYAKSAGKRLDLPYFTSDEAVYNGVTINQTQLKDLHSMLGEPDRIESSEDDDWPATVYYYESGGRSAEYHSYGYSGVIHSIVIRDTGDSPAPRGIRTGDSLDSVLEKFPYEYDYYLHPWSLFFGEPTVFGQGGMLSAYFDEETGKVYLSMILTSEQVDPYMRIEFEDGFVTQIELNIRTT